MTPEYSVQLIEQHGKLLREGNPDFLRGAIENLYHVLMELEVEEQINASRYERTKNRITSRNGSRKRALETTVGKIELNIPKLRKGSYMPSFIEPRRMTDKALVEIIQDAYINGVSTNGTRELLGYNIGMSETGEYWTNFLQSLVNRELKGVKLVISDSHQGSKTQ